MSSRYWNSHLFNYITNCVLFRLGKDLYCGDASTGAANTYLNINASDLTAIQVHMSHSFLYHLGITLPVAVSTSPTLNPDASLTELTYCIYCLFDYLPLDVEQPSTNQSQFVS